MRLAEHVEHTVHTDVMLAGMSTQEFNEWCAKDELEPIGHAGTHEILAQIAAMLATFLGAKKVDQYTYKWWQQRPEPAEAQDDVAVAALKMVGWKET